MLCLAALVVVGEEEALEQKLCEIRTTALTDYQVTLATFSSAVGPAAVEASAKLPGGFVYSHNLQTSATIRRPRIHL